MWSSSLSFSTFLSVPLERWEHQESSGPSETEGQSKEKGEARHAEGKEQDEEDTLKGGGDKKPGKGSSE